MLVCTIPDLRICVESIINLQEIFTEGVNYKDIF